ncbi:G-X-X-X-Q-X-W domain-containing protein [Pholiota conissans]|uniref:G-X-X-X-Q-X-W domain-containing protein n=1 Tax=Pholiota conissans TaxID=109636 RepID=A0A9P5YSP5_9AGAR|nr:G-X-X-X-Q-X-W domain-containing protein [Pholiota conissans]
MLPLLLSTLLFATPLLASPVSPRQTTRQYIVHNQCPAAVNLYIAGAFDSTIPQGGNVTKFLSTGAGFWYTDANLGTPTAEGTAKAGFLDDFYYIVTDPTYINAGISVAPRDRPAVDGFCPKIECDSRDCANAFTQPPTRFPSPSNIAPTPPYYRCPYSNTTYDITFCPTGVFPPLTTTLHPDYTVQKCIDVRGAVFANGTPVQIYDCNGTPAQNWVLTRGGTKVQLAGTNFCLDAGSSPANGVGLKIWQCYDNLPAQQWYYTLDNRIALEAKGFCTDLPNGNQANANQLQTWQCTDNNQNQVWTI